ncbi:MAG: hypothetical protein AAFV53_02995 [Myxococcota bacterium]
MTQGPYYQIMPSIDTNTFEAGNEIQPLTLSGTVAEDFIVVAPWVSEIHIYTSATVTFGYAADNTPGPIPSATWLEIWKQGKLGKSTNRTIHLNGTSGDVVVCRVV